MPSGQTTVSNSLEILSIGQSNVPGGQTIASNRQTIESSSLSCICGAGSVP